MNCAVYVRVSVDRPEETSTTTQEARCREYAEKRGWTVVAVYEDKGRSAFKREVKRPALDRLMKDVEAGVVGAVVCWRLDRWCRSLTEFGNLWDRLRGVNCEWASVTEQFDTTSAMGKAMVGVAVLFAELESGIKSERLTEWHRHREAVGSPPTIRPTFGFGPDWKPDKTTAPMLRKAATDLLDGASVRSILRSWNEAGILTTRGNKWSRLSLIKCLRSPSIAGLREIDGTLVQGRWPAVIDRDTWDRVNALLADPIRRTNGGGHMARKMLSGILHCGLCGGPMGHRGHRAGPRYVCKPNFEDETSCGSLSIDAKLADDYIKGAIIAAVGDGLPAIEVHDPGEVSRLEGELSALAADYGAGSITRPEWQAARAGLENRLNESIARASRATATIPANLATEWDRLTVEQRRSIILTVMEDVTIKPGYSKQDRIAISWRG
ncbi:recombinase family protein [soil metagenome]